jgi:hypothetical protein
MAVGLKVAKADRAMLGLWLRAPTKVPGLGLRARMILASASGEGVRPMERRLDLAQYGRDLAPTLPQGGTVSIIIRKSPPFII